MIKALSYKDYSPREEKTKREGLILVNIALGDADFERRWVDPSVNCTENKGLTQREILQKLREDIGIQFRAYRKWWSKVVGYFISGNTIWDNLKYVDIGDATESGSNDLHETCHVKGFTHNNRWNSSVPYTANRIFEEWAEAYQSKRAAAMAPMSTDLTHPLTSEQEHA